ncbi:hypothetical protein [Grapevine virus G]|uniref:Uncharacterized protein n=1 Tax=Grapevine virus G TaxID=2022475 RepID=A0A2H4N957_9VIRU|nr:hypothetical protein [Grapevine virus G]ATV81249.1 hypothetical protein [Grapevine virus G]ATV81257.1 hypothetical protein [Grapevine virus G]ATV81262.1 hypothetical protein [Grapevine virus G]ATV81267.1 hypothetical protein [Grapevine virus G]
MMEGLIKDRFSLEELVNIYNNLVISDIAIPDDLDFLLRLGSSDSSVVALRNYLLGNHSAQVQSFSYSPTLVTQPAYPELGDAQRLTELLGFSVVTSENLKSLHRFSGGNLMHLSVLSGQRVVLMNYKLHRINLSCPHIHHALQGIKIISNCLFLV